MFKKLLEYLKPKEAIKPVEVFDPYKCSVKTCVTVDCNRIYTTALKSDLISIEIYYSPTSTEAMDLVEKLYLPDVTVVNKLYYVLSVIDEQHMRIGLISYTTHEGFEFTGEIFYGMRVKIKVANNILSVPLDTVINMRSLDVKDLMNQLKADVRNSKINNLLDEV